MTALTGILFLFLFFSTGQAYYGDIDDDYVLNNKTFPQDFMFGTATSAYQIEGAWNEGGKSPSIWDTLVHTNPSFVVDGSNGDVACNSYHEYEQDVDLLKNLGVSHYRFSLAWTRILPNGIPDQVNQAGITYYKNLIKLLKDNNIVPLVTLYHWDLPQVLQDQGAFLNESIAQWFTDYARVCFEAFGDDVKHWITFNEPKQVCDGGYGYGYMAPAIKSEGLLEYVCAHNLLKAHAAMWHLYDDEYREKQQGEISIVIDCSWYEPASDLEQDIEAAETAMEFDIGWFANPVYVGDYPYIMKYRVGIRSVGEGYNQSRLPEFTDDEIAYIKGTYDFFALNFYTAQMGQAMEEPPMTPPPTRWGDIGVNMYQPADWESTVANYLKVTPWGIRKILKFIKDRYNDPRVIITENGVPEDGSTLQDDQRIRYLQTYVSNVRDAMEMDGVRVFAYTFWSLMDNFEWQSGYTQKYGLYHVDFNTPNRTRTPKQSVDVYKKLLATKCLVDQCEDAD